MKAHPKGHFRPPPVVFHLFAENLPKNRRFPWLLCFLHLCPSALTFPKFLSKKRSKIVQKFIDTPLAL